MYLRFKYSIRVLNYVHPLNFHRKLHILFNNFHLHALASPRDKNEKSRFRLIIGLGGVAYILTNEAKITDPEVIQAALLHDTVEDTDTTLEEIELEFGVNIRNIVGEVTDDKTLPKAERKRLQIVHAKHCTYQAKLVKLADKLYNLRDLQTIAPDGWSKERCLEYFKWSKQVVDNLRGTNQQLEASLDAIFGKECPV